MNINEIYDKKLGEKPASLSSRSLEEDLEQQKIGEWASHPMTGEFLRKMRAKYDHHIGTALELSVKSFHNVHDKHDTIMSNLVAARTIKIEILDKYE